ncbi:NAD(P)/FAD-dependent oxidoreductase [Flavobacterium sp. Sd200]|uniref:NAD(P)/FAD-dependent oxidoreductase n=1 Tax=Flavobacterium sp. Sd200 TaxID=2692211 RepID=UPI001370E330|nr:NAD(P)/FAD-dependent oxidoreductase [Flavobacterium sp. Sd200]MXN93102.1 NAD(P)/FAD-dependent oxidoreductase [Flavobacterium sp. Sd200]
MQEKQILLYDVIIIGGSYAGLSAAMSLGRSLRRILIIDSANPCNKSTPFAHNFITNDGQTPQNIRDNAQKQVLAYPTVTFLEDLATDVIPNDEFFTVLTEKNETFISKKILFATGVTDTMPNISGFGECWGKTILHCPYCHGYEAKGKKTAVIGNGDMGYELAKVINHWTDNLTLYTNGTSTLTPNEMLKLQKHDIAVIEHDIDYLDQENGILKAVYFKDATPQYPEVIYTQLPFIQQCSIPEKLGLKTTEKGFIHVTNHLETSIQGIFAAGDCLSLFRSVAHAVASGNKAGAIINKCLIDEEF